MQIKAIAKRLLSALAMGLLLGLSQGSQALESNQVEFSGKRPKPYAAYDGKQLAPPSRSIGENGSESVKVVVLMSEQSVAEARSLSPTHKIEENERASIRQRVQSQHASVHPQLKEHGARIHANFHSALNGIKIEVHPSRIASIASLPGVVAVLPVGRYTAALDRGVPYIGAPAVWQGTPEYQGEGVKIAVIDSGIDYTHASFGGPGTLAAFLEAAANGTAPADPSLFGPGAPKVKGGIDLVGDDYDARLPGSVPQPDPNPLDCATSGHGTAVAGAAAGTGVTPQGSTYVGPYDQSIYTLGKFRIGPGVAPKSELYAVRVMGCDLRAGTDVMVEAFDWAIQHDMDVINLSMGAPYGGQTADALAATNAVKAGVVVAAVAGNQGPAPYIMSGPSVADGVLSVAAIDGRPGIPAVIIKLAGGGTVTAQDSNNAPMPAGPLPVTVLRNADGTVSLGCDAAEYAGTAGKLVVVQRGVCGRIFRAQYGQAAGAAAVAMINNADDFGVYEGPLPGVSIPFLGVRPAEAGTLIGASAALAFAGTEIPNPALGTAASFTSGGPRLGDSALKPSVSAPGVAITTSLVGTGNGTWTVPGTSVATPQVAGAAALVAQAHPNWHAADQAAAVAQTADPSKLPDYSARLEGAGLVQPLAATRTHVVATVDGQPLAAALSFGFAEFVGDFQDKRTLRVKNLGSRKASFAVSARATGGDPHSVRLSRDTVSIEAGESRSIEVSLSVPGATAGTSSQFNDVAGLVTLVPASAHDNNGVALNIPYYLVERSRSDMSAELKGDFGPRHPSGTVSLKNAPKGASANADFYAWGLSGTRQGAAPFDVRAVGVQSFPIDATTNQLVFAVNTFDRFNAPVTGEIDIFIDSNGDGYPDYVIWCWGDLATNVANGNLMVAVYDVSTGQYRTVAIGYAPTDGSIIEIPVSTADLGLSPSNPTFSYQVYSTTWRSQLGGQVGVYNAVPGIATFNAFTPSISTGDWVPVAPGKTASVPVSIDPQEWLKSPALGLMIVNLENRSGGPQATLLRVGK